MARITVEDCLKHVKNRFVLVMLAAKRARQLMRGRADPTVPWENDKATVVALREIATGHTDFSDAYEMDNDKVETTTTVSDVFISTSTETLIESDTTLDETNNHLTDAIDSIDSKDLEDSE